LSPPQEAIISAATSRMKKLNIFVCMATLNLEAIACSHEK
jgi:hypothetical protein